MIEESQDIDVALEFPTKPADVTQQVMAVVQGFPKGPVDSTTAMMGFDGGSSALIVTRNYVGNGGLIGVSVVWAVGGALLGMGVGRGLDLAPMVVGLLCIVGGIAFLFSKETDTATVRAVPAGEDATKVTVSGRIDGALLVRLNAVVGAAYGVRF